MKKIVSVIVLSLMVMPAFAARRTNNTFSAMPPQQGMPPAQANAMPPSYNPGRAGVMPPSQANAMPPSYSPGRAGVMPPQQGMQQAMPPQAGYDEARAGTMSKNQISAAATLAPDVAIVQKSSVKVDGDVTDIVSADLAINPEQMISAQKKDMREKEKHACIANNIGVGNTFVWASRYSNLNNYASMVEDVELPENNTCFVKVELKSNDSKIGVSDVPAKYYEWGQNITCGAWADYDVLKKRILDAKKSTRTWATVAGAVGGAAVGVGAMELFGNKMIGGSVQGQKALEGDELLRSQLAVLKKDNESEYKKFVGYLKVLKTECNLEHILNLDDPDLKSKCDEFKGIFDLAA